MYVWIYVYIWRLGPKAYIYVYVCVCVYRYIHITHTHTHTLTWCTYVCRYVRMHMYTYRCQFINTWSIHIHVYTSKRIYILSRLVCVCLYEWVCTSVCVCIHTHTYTAVRFTYKVDPRLKPTDPCHVCGSRQRFSVTAASMFLGPTLFTAYWNSRLQWSPWPIGPWPATLSTYAVVMKATKMAVLWIPSHIWSSTFPYNIYTYVICILYNVCIIYITIEQIHTSVSNVVCMFV